MGIAAVFVDAGYLFSGGSDLLFGGRTPREALRLLDPELLLKEIIVEAAAELGDKSLRVLRTYWYDGARDGVPAREQVAIGSLPKVKLRLGRVTGSGQKGVDGLIIIDLLSLAMNRAIDTAILFSGDEDLREAALFAQTHGVTVVLVGLPQTQRQRQSVLLVRESDHHVVLTPALVSRHLQRQEPSTPTSSERELPSPETATGGAEAAATAAIEDAPSDNDSTTDASLETLLSIAEGVVLDRRFEAGGLLELGLPRRLSREADRLLVGRLAAFTGVFPVDRTLLLRVRRMCLDLADNDGTVSTDEPGRA